MLEVGAMIENGHGNWRTLEAEGTATSDASVEYSALWDVSPSRV
jgi:hypothetical protein